MFSDRAFLHPLISIHVQSMMAQNRAVELNQVVGSHLLSFLEEVDATNFIEAVNNSRQFWCIAKSLDQHFIKLINTFLGQQRILLPRALFESYTGELQIDEENLIVFSKRYSWVRQPCERLYIHPSFSFQGFASLNFVMFIRVLFSSLLEHTHTRHSTRTNAFIATPCFSLNEKSLEDSGGIYMIYFCFCPKESLSYYAS
jgi:hypothetical protein